MTYAVQALQKIMGVAAHRAASVRAEALALATFQYPQPLQPTGEANRTEIDITKQVITLYENYQVRLITTTSTGSGERYCYNTPRVNPTRRVCEDANTPSGRFTLHRVPRRLGQVAARPALQPLLLQRRHRGARLRVGARRHPASHGCTRIPMHIAEYFHTLVHVGDPVYVFGGTPANIVSSTPIAPAPPPTPPPTAAAPTAPPATAPPARPRRPTAADHHADRHHARRPPDRSSRHGSRRLSGRQRAETASLEAGVGEGVGVDRRRVDRDGAARRRGGGEAVVAALLELVGQLRARRS